MKNLAVFDLDGTLALVDHRRPLLPDYDAFHAACVKDKPNKNVVKVLRTLLSSGRWGVQVWTGRPEQYRDRTEWWLRRHVLNNLTTLHASSVDLLMRPMGELSRPDEELKFAWLLAVRAAGRDVAISFDDRDKLVAMWRDHGVTCCQVAEGDF